MDSGMSSTETIPRISSDEELSQDSIYYKDEKIVDEVYIEAVKKDKRFKKIIITTISVASLILFTAILPPLILLSSGKTSAYTGKKQILIDMK